MQFSTGYTNRSSSALESLLERFAVETCYVPPQARLIDSLDELPLSLELKATGCGTDATWRAWTSEGCIWFMIGRVSRWSVCCPDRLLLHALFFDVAGELVSSGVWRRERPGRWTPRLA
jgi:hypothetical protein